MSEEQLNGLSLLYIDKDIEIDCDNISKCYVITLSKKSTRSSYL